jgi:hypothetical protein
MSNLQRDGSPSTVGLAGPTNGGSSSDPSQEVEAELRLSSPSSGALSGRPATLGQTSSTQTRDDEVPSHEGTIQSLVESDEQTETPKTGHTRSVITFGMIPPLGSDPTGTARIGGTSFVGQPRRTERTDG